MADSYWSCSGAATIRRLGSSWEWTRSPANGVGGNFNRYWYANNNPYKFKDPDGRYIETAVDIAFIASDVADIGKNGLGWTNGLALAADVVGAALPGATGLGAGVKSIAAVVGAARVVDRASNMAQFLKASEFGKSIAGSLAKTSKQFHGQSVFKVTEKVGGTVLKKGDQVYLDAKHKDHLEVLDSKGNAKAVLNLDGTVNAAKTEAAIEMSRRLE